MLTVAELKTMLSDIEADTVERTVSTKDTDKFGQAICAFANDLPRHQQTGYLLIGVKGDGTLNGLTVTDQLLKDLAAIRADGNIQPLPALSVYKMELPEGGVAVVEVLPSDLPPVRYKGRVYIRVGPRKAIANEQEERLLSEKRVSFARSFDAHPCQEATVDDLALDIFTMYRKEAVDAETIAENHRSIEEQLASLRFYDLKKRCPTFAGILLFGKNPRFNLPGAYLQFLKFPSTSLTDVPDDQAEISGDLLTVLRELDARIRVNIKTSLKSVSALREQPAPDYPEWAIRELLMNAVMHRNYDSNTPIRFYWFADRIEIHSPGGLYGEVTDQNYMSQNSYRNPVIAEAMKGLGYVNRYGYGIQRAQKLLAENGNPPAEFTFAKDVVLAVIRRISN